ncbi:MAG TPA: PAS domain S-box protein [Candidatus Acidoferrales bacterium]|nr:PAS domain S-box protein [Candidatus Acidoferrales bacterium]
MMSEHLANDREKPKQAESRPEPALERLVEIISRSQQNYRELIDNLDQAVFTLSLDGEILVANRRVAELLDAPFAEFIGHPFTDFVESPSLADAKRSRAFLAENGTWRGTIPVRLRKDKRLRHFSCWFQAVTEKNEITAVIGWARDASAEHDSEVRLAELFASLREGMFFAAPDGRLRDANPALERMLGYTEKEQIRAKNLRDFYVRSAEFESLMRELESSNSVEDREIVLRHRSGREIHCRASAVSIRDALGRFAGFQGTLVDVTESREIERRLQQEQEFVRRLIANFPDVIAVLDCEGRYTYVSQRVEDLLGNSPRQYIGEEVTRRVNPEDAPKLREALQQLLTAATPQVQVEFRLQHRDGTWRTLRANAGPLYEGERISGVVASARDVTDSKHFEEQLTRSEKFAAMGQMLTGAAHELNNPLTAILGVGDLLRERATDDSARRHADIVVQQARRAADIVQNLLAFSRPPAQGRLKIQLAGVVKQLVDSQWDRLAAKNIALRFSAPEGLPLVEADAKLLSQAFLNILTNAEQAISPARGRGSIEISLAARDGFVVVTFADDGPGIPPGDIQRIFDPFFTTKRPGGGSGLGLTISLVVVKEHGGTIEVQSQAGAGAIFRVLLPAVPEEARTPSRSSEKGASKASRALSNRSVLVVDDEESIREIVQEGLATRGLKVDCAENVPSALRLLAAETYDFVLCDFNLPGQLGTELFERVRQGSSQPAHAFVFMTGDLVEPAKAADLKKKGAHILQKPFQVSALAALLVDLLQPQSSVK